MSIVKKYIAIYSNLPSGGAKELHDLNINFLKKKTSIIFLSDSNIIPKNFLEYLVTSIFKLPRIHKLMAEQIPKSNQVLIAYHSWITKSPHILRYVTGPKIYICQEVMREYYDKNHITNQSFKEKIVNLLRLPIKFIDIKNLESKNLRIIVNSQFSKILVDKYFKVSSIVVYPGINYKLYIPKKIIRKSNQIISVGAINRLKRYDFLLEVVSKIEIRHRPKLVLVGNGSNQSYQSILEKKAYDLGVILEIKTNISRAELVNEYHRSKVFIYSPISEPFGIVVEEAMAAGLPLIVYGKGGGYVEILTHKNGIIMDTLNAKDWSVEVKRLLTNPSLRKTYCTHNKNYVKNNYSVNKMNNSIWNIISSL